MKFAGHTFVISRRSATDRRDLFRRQADAIGLEDWGFFDALDGLAMRLGTRTPSVWGRAGRSAPQPLSPGEVGCVLSHLAILRTARAMGASYVTVIEDDVEVVSPASFAEDWARFEREVPDDWLMVHAAGSDVSPETAPEPVSEHVARVRHSYGTRFMMLRRDAIYMLTDMEVTLDRPADWLLPPLFETGGVYCPRAPLLHHRNDPGISTSPHDLSQDRPHALEEL